MTQVTRRLRFEAAHYLPEHDGQCAQMHGHSWTAEVTLEGEVQTGGVKNGMVVDMGNVAAFFTEALEPHLDHRCLNDTLPDAYLPPSTENVARYLLDMYAEGGFPVVRVVVRETENQTATVLV